MYSRFWLSCLDSFGFPALKDFQIIGHSNFSTLSIPDEGYPRNGPGTPI